MKKIISIIILLALALYISGCTNTSKEAKEEQSSTEDLSEDLSEIDNLDKELDDSELDDLSQDLENIDW